MKFSKTKIEGVIIIEPILHQDHRGFFMEIFREDIFKDNGCPYHFVQDNHSLSKQGTLRGLHFQKAPHAQAKLVRVLSGKVFDVAVDLRPNSPTYGQWVGQILSAANRKMMAIPPEFAHGFYVLSDSAEVVYKCSKAYHQDSEQTIRWNDPDLAIQWPLLEDIPLKMSGKDEAAPLFAAVCTTPHVSNTDNA